MLNYSRIGVVMATILLSGCANLATVSRRTEIPAVPVGGNGSPAFAGGMAIHLDASQRLFYQAGGHFCAEPMPDALQSLASSSGVGVAAGDKVSAAVSSAFSTNAASIGLHTQSTTLMRDQYYRICELAANSNMSGPQVAQLMERAQRYTLGILAVEQLTGAVVGEQAALSSDATASSSSSLGATAEALNKAQAILADKKTIAAAAATSAATADAKAKESAKVVAAEGDDPVDADEVQQATDEAAASAAEKDAATAQANVQIAQKTVDVLTANVGAAQAKADAAAKGSVTLGASATQSNIDSTTAVAIATATDSIVGRLLERGDIVDSCMAMMMDTNATTFFSTHGDLLASCQLVMQASAKVAIDGGKIPFRMALTMDPETVKALRSMSPKIEATPERRKK